MPVLDGAEPELVLVETEVGFVDTEVARVVEDLVDVTVVFDDDGALVEVELGFDVSAPGTHWPGALVIAKHTIGRLTVVLVIIVTGVARNAGSLAGPACQTVSTGRKA